MVQNIVQWFTIVMSKANKWVPNKLQNSRDLRKDPSNLPESKLEVQKASDLQKRANTDPPNCQQKQSLSSSIAQNLKIKLR